MLVIHQTQPMRHTGVPLPHAKCAMVLLHGRGGSAEDILSLAHELNIGDMCCFAPQARDQTWYPNRFIAPIASNEPYLTSALETVDALVTHIAKHLAPIKIFILGFSQGACLALEYAARHPRCYGGVFGLSGALIENGDQPRHYDGSLDQTPIFLGCSDSDFHIPLARVKRTSQILQTLNADVTERIYPNMGHTINLDEIIFVKNTVQNAIAKRSTSAQ